MKNYEIEQLVEFYNKLKDIQQKLEELKQDVQAVQEIYGDQPEADLETYQQT